MLSDVWVEGPFVNNNRTYYKHVEKYHESNMKISTNTRRSLSPFRKLFSILYLKNCKNDFSGTAFMRSLRALRGPPRAHRGQCAWVEDETRRRSRGSSFNQVHKMVKMHPPPPSQTRGENIRNATPINDEPPSTPSTKFQKPFKTIK